MSARVLRARRVSCATLVCATLFMSACEVDRTAEVDLATLALASAGSGGSAGCVPRDTQDTVPDRVDEDCDGRIDENVEGSRANCPSGTRVIEGTRGNDVLKGTSGRDCILGYGGNDTIYGLGGDDVIWAGPGNDRVYSGSGSSIVRGGSGDDWIDTSHSCGATAYGEAGRDTLLGGSGNEVFYGGDDNDVLKGGGGSDKLNGDGCHDSLHGGTGRDAANGGADVDACDAETTSACEGARTSCSSDANCPATERCAANVNFCVPRSAAGCGSCAPGRPVDDTCDGIDDDCDGQVDDDYVPSQVSCGSGSCAATGVTQCVNSQVQNSCEPGMPLPGNDASCDGRDDDCDGRVDEGFMASERSCGTGVCARTGSVICEAGVVVDSCQPGGPISALDETCDGLDDDCDGIDDEDVPTAPTSCGLGVCASTGVAACSGGRIVDSCVPGVPTASIDLSCDGLDDDCNGSVDDAFPGTPTNCGFGLCARVGMTTCVEGQIADSCQVTCEGQCNDGAEDDGDGLIDCLDPDCRNAVGCLQGSFGSPCISNFDCNRVGPEAFCITGMPGGYCTRPCSTGCPAGTHCLTGGTSCVVDCGPGDHCGRPNFVCSPVGFEGSEGDAFCHGDCSLSCPIGTVCNPTTYRCVLPS